MRDQVFRNLRRIAIDQVHDAGRDTGVGISAEDQSRIFEEFYQVGAARTQEGTGLGLALTKRLVELHHGSLGLESEPGVGSTFTVTLPLHQSPVPAESETETQPAAAASEGPAAS